MKKEYVVPIMKDIATYDPDGMRIRQRIYGRLLWAAFKHDGFTAEEIVSISLDGFVVPS